MAGWVVGGEEDEYTSMNLFEEKKKMKGILKKHI